MNLMPEFRYHRAQSLQEAARLKAALPSARLLAGGTDLIVNLRRGLGAPTDLIDLQAVPQLRAIRSEGEALWIGAGVTLAALARDPEVARHPALVEAALAVAGPTHRVAATLGGNLCQDTRCVFYNQSDWWRESNGWCLKYSGERCHVVDKNDRCYATYHGDIAPVLMVLDAWAVVVAEGGARRVEFADFYRENGAEHLALGPAELLEAVVIPPQGERRAAYAKMRIRDAVDFPLAGVAVSLRREGDLIADIKVAVTGTNSAPLLIATSELIGRRWDAEAADQLVRATRKQLNVLATTVAGPKYRRRAALTLTRRLVDQVWSSWRDGDACASR